MKDSGSQSVGGNSPAHRLIYVDAHAYCAHPHIVARHAGDWLLVFNQSVRRSGILHPPQDPRYCNLISLSADQGETWTTPQVVPDSNWTGVECAGLTVLADDSVLLNQWQFDWYSHDQAARAAVSVHAVGTSLP